jgi:hypothetical protein
MASRHDPKDPATMTAEELRAACEQAAGEIPCKCRSAVCRAYREMIASGASHADAHMVAARVYRYHHPGYPVDQVNRFVARLVEPDQLH